jgi:hypothetical protein
LKIVIDTTTILAFWGATLSSIVFAWDVYKYRNAGPRLRFTVLAGMVMRPAYNDATFIKSEITNCGDRATTLTGISVYYFEKQLSWERIRNRPTRALVLDDMKAGLKNLDFGTPFPCELKPGAVWRGLTPQDPQLEQWAKQGALYFDLYHSHRTKPIRRRLSLNLPRVLPPPSRL